MPREFVCTICDLTEQHCGCDKYCWLCQSEHDVRLCEDGQYYCPPCREACDMAAQYHPSGSQ